MRKGFTLIELLAVIVILAIVALIATPIILNIIGSAKEESNERSVELYAESVKEAVARYQMNNNESITGEFSAVDGTDGKQIQQENTILNIDYDGKVVCQTVKIDKSGSINLTGCKVNDDYINYIYNGKVIAVPTPKSFAEDDWSTIIANVQAGNIDVYSENLKKLEKYEKNIELKGNVSGTYKVRIANTTTSEECNNLNFSQTACGFVIEFVDIINYYKINPSETNEGGWRDSSIRTYMKNYIYVSFPEEVKESIIDTMVVSGYEKKATENYITTDKIYLLSTKEVYGDNHLDDTAQAQTRQLDLYSLNRVTISENRSLSIKSTSRWWLRSANSDSDSCFYRVISDGSWTCTPANNDITGIAPAFRLG